MKSVRKKAQISYPEITPSPRDKRLQRDIDDLLGRRNESWKSGKDLKEAVKRALRKNERRIREILRGEDEKRD